MEKNGILSVFEGKGLQWSSSMGRSKVTCTNINHRPNHLSTRASNTPASHPRIHSSSDYQILTPNHSRQTIPYTCFALTFYFLVVKFLLLSINKQGIQEEESRDTEIGIPHPLCLMFLYYQLVCAVLHL